MPSAVHLTDQPWWGQEILNASSKKDNFHKNKILVT